MVSTVSFYRLCENTRHLALEKLAQKSPIYEPILCNGVLGF